MKETYNLEGDGPLVLQCYEAVDSLTTAICLAHTPNVKAIAQRLAGMHCKQRPTLSDVVS